MPNIWSSFSFTIHDVINPRKNPTHNFCETVGSNDSFTLSWTVMMTVNIFKFKCLNIMTACKKKNKFNCHELSFWIHCNTVLCGLWGRRRKTKQNKTKITVLWCLIISFPASLIIYWGSRSRPIISREWGAFKWQGGFSHWHGIWCILCACLLGHFFTKFGIAIGGFSSENWVYFGQIIVKSTQFGQNWVLSFENGILMGGKLGKKLV